MNDLKLTRMISIVTLVGNIVFIVWIIFNGIDSGWKGTPVEIVSFVSLMLLAVLNSYLIVAALRRQ